MAEATASLGPEPAVAQRVNVAEDDSGRASDRRAGQGLVEYGLILALSAVVAIIALIFLGTQVSSILSKVGSSV